MKTEIVKKIKVLAFISIIIGGIFAPSQVFAVGPQPTAQNPEVQENKQQDREEDKKAEEEKKEGDQQADCDATKGVALSWVICPLVDLGTNFTDWAFQSFIEPMLENVPVSSKRNDGSYIAWSQFRIMANVLLVGTLMVIVYSQAKGGD